MVAYIDRIEKEGVSVGLNLSSTVEQLGSATPIAATVGNAVVGNEGVKAAEMKELKKMTKQLRQLIDLKKQDNLMAAIFYICVIALGIVHVLIITH